MGADQLFEPVRIARYERLDHLSMLVLGTSPALTGAGHHVDVEARPIAQLADHLDDQVLVGDPIHGGVESQVSTDPLDRGPGVGEVFDARAQTPLGRRLEQIRAEIVAAKTPLLSWEDLEREVSERRGDSAPAGTE